jgi:lactate racemase
MNSEDGIKYYLNYEGGKMSFALPRSWHVISTAENLPTAVVSDIDGEIDRALDNPIGSPPIEKLARSGMSVCLLFDDQQRPTPADRAVPRIMNRLNAAGIPDEHIVAVCAGGTHPMATTEQLLRKLGKEVFDRLGDRLFVHNARSVENVVIGRTHRGGIVEINKAAASADLVLGIGQCLPHPGAGFSGGYKIVMPGVSSYRSIADHHFHYLRNKSVHVNTLDGNPFWEEIVDAGRLARLAFKLDFVMNEEGKVIKAFAGEPEAEQRQAGAFVERLFIVELPRRTDITITSAAPLEMGVQATKALAMATGCTRTGGTIVWVASQKNAGPILPLIEEIGKPFTANQVHQQFVEGKIPESLHHLGVSYVSQIVSFKETTEAFNVIHVTEGLSATQVEMMGMAYSADLQKTVDELAAKHPEAHVAVFPSGGSVIPVVR